MRLLRMCLVLAVVAYGLVLTFSLGSFGTSSSSAYEYSFAHIIVTKHVVNDDGGSAVAPDFTMTIGGVVAQGGNSFPGSESGTDKVVTVVATGSSYSVSETGPAGYNSSFSSGCSGTISAGQTVNCTVTNDDTAIKATGSGNVGDVSFDLSFKNNGGQLSGTCAVNEVQPRTRIKCLDVTSLTATQLSDGERAVVQGHATINGVATTYTMTLEDHGSPGVGHDSFTIDTTSGYHRSGILSGGNITITLS
jgi:Prealbumin-like fold domain